MREDIKVLIEQADQAACEPVNPPIDAAAIKRHLATVPALRPDGDMGLACFFASSGATSHAAITLLPSDTRRIQFWEIVAEIKINYLAQLRVPDNQTKLLNSFHCAPCVETEGGDVVF